MKKNLLILSIITILTACASGDGQLVYHWERYNTGIEKFARDHSQYMREAESFNMMPRIKTLWHSMFYTEEKKISHSRRLGCRKRYMGNLYSLPRSSAVNRKLLT